MRCHRQLRRDPRSAAVPQPSQLFRTLRGRDERPLRRRRPASPTSRASSLVRRFITVRRPDPPTENINTVPIPILAHGFQNRGIPSRVTLSFSQTSRLLVAPASVVHRKRPMSAPSALASTASDALAQSPPAPATRKRRNRRAQSFQHIAARNIDHFFSYGLIFSSVIQLAPASFF